MGRVATDKIRNAEEFDPHKHLSGTMKHNKLEAKYEYRNADGELLGYAVRMIESQSGKKQVLPVTYCYNAATEQYSWRFKGFLDKGCKPIYGAEKLNASNKPILIVEGEKAAIAASKMLPEYDVLSWMGGSNAADKVNWGQLKCREVIIWPDNDEAGFKAAEIIKAHINKANGHIGFVSVVDPRALRYGGNIHQDILPQKWDLADKLPENVSIDNIKEAITNIKSAHLDMKHIENVIGELKEGAYLTLPSHADTDIVKPNEHTVDSNKHSAGLNISELQQIAERHVWQSAFKGQLVDAAQGNRGG